MKLKITVPLHITGFFSPHFSENPLFSGSTGAGLVIVPGLNCICQFLDKKKAKTEILYNGVETSIEPIEKLLKFFNKGVFIRISSPVPLGAGYGASGASTLAVSLALHRFLGKSDLEASRMAHLAEVESLSGLGDVLAIFSGRDLEVRIKPGAPGIGIVKFFRQPKNLRIVATDLKKEDTKKMLKLMKPEVVRLGQDLLKRFIKEPNLDNFFEYSQLFAKEIGWADENFFKKLEPIKKYCPGFSVKKGVLFAVVKDSCLPKVISMLKNFSRAIHIFKFGGGIKKDEK